MKCSKGYYFDENRRCKIVDPQCKNFDHLQKICKMCYLGYTLYEGLCLNSNDTPNIVSATTNCVEMNDDGECERCSSFYYL